MDKEKKDTTQTVRPLTWPIRTANSDIEQSHSLKKKKSDSRIDRNQLCGYHNRYGYNLLLLSHKKTYLKQDRMFSSTQ